MRQVPAVLLVALVAASSLAAPTPPDPAVAWTSSTVTWTCDEARVNPRGDVAYDNTCPDGGAIRPGVRANGCTLSWVVTDGTEMYITTAGHCGTVGTSFSVPGVGTIGSIVFRANLRDWAFIKIDPALHGLVDPTMVHYGGPTGAGTTIGLDPVRAPVPGDGVFQYGHGYGFGQEEGTKARAGVVAAVTPTAFVYPGTVGGGDSGSPARFATGEAAGIVVAAAGLITGDNRDYVPDRCATVEALAPGACAPYWDACNRLDDACDGPWRPNGIYGAVFVTRLDAAIEAFETWLGKPVTVLAGDLPDATVILP